MPTSWRKIEDENGFPYYFNESTKIKQWDHPKFGEIKQRIDDCNYVKHSKYRVALKFRVLQQALYMEEIPLNIVCGVFERHQLGANESSLCLESCDLEAVLSDIYFAANKQNHTNIDIDYATELMQNFLFNVYDKDREGKIQVSSTKLVLALLSHSLPTEVNNFIFKLCADHNNCVTRLRLQSLLMKLVEISVFMHEDVSFGQHLVNSSIENCFSNSPGLVGIAESNFIAWLEKGPQLMAWILVLRRIKSSETVVHAGKCSSCKTSPLMGLRYRCLKCSRFTQCQRCFFTGRTSNSHKLSHSMKEYSTETDTKDFNYNFIKKMCGLLPCSMKLNETNIVEVKPAITSDKDFLLKSVTSESLYNMEPLSPPPPPHAQLQTIIRRLEQQNRELQQILLLGSHDENEIRKYLEEHRIHVAAQIHKLKILMDYLNVPTATLAAGVPKHFESTPMVKVGGNQANRNTQALEFLSPIVQDRETDDSTSCNNRNYSQDTLPYTVNDISTWIGGQSSSKSELIRKSPVRELHSDLDDALAKLQQILANNFTLDESLGNIDNSHLKHAVSEVEGMLTSIIDNVESSRSSSVQPFAKYEQETELLSGIFN